MKEYESVSVPDYSTRDNMVIQLGEEMRESKW